MRHRWRPERTEQGQTFLVVVVIVTVVLAGILVVRVANTAESINKKAGTISKTVVPINTATDAVLNLPRTNELAGSILQTAQPLQGKLAEIVRLAKSVDGLAASINGSATSVDGTAKGINGTAAGILDTARSIDRGVKQIIINLNTTIPVAGAIKADSGNILGTAVGIHHNASCIDAKLGILGALPLIGGGAGGPDGHC
jgi:methyl-accepting chemotaxis protein